MVAALGQSLAYVQLINHIREKEEIIIHQIIKQSSPKAQEYNFPELCPGNCKVNL